MGKMQVQSKSNAGWAGLVYEDCHNKDDGERERKRIARVHEGATSSAQLHLQDER